MPNISKVKDSSVRAAKVYNAAYNAVISDLTDSDIPHGKIEDMATFVAEKMTESFIAQHYVAYGGKEELSAYDWRKLRGIPS